MGKPDYADGTIQAKAAFTADFGLPDDIPLDQVAPLIERDRLIMSQQPGMRQKHLPMRLDLASGNFFSCVRYIFDTAENAEKYKAWAENDFIVSSLLQGLPVAERSHYWIGGTDQGLEGTFAWVTGEAFGAYTNFWAAEPNNSNNEDFLAFDLRSGGWRWNDAPDNLAQAYGFARGYIMERSQLTQVPEPASITLLGVGLLAAAFARRKRA